MQLGWGGYKWQNTEDKEGHPDGLEKNKLFWVLSTASFLENTDKSSKNTLPSKGTQSMNVGLNPSPFQQVKLFQGNEFPDTPP